jgi:hypothetical protein
MNIFSRVPKGLIVLALILAVTAFFSRIAVVNVERDLARTGGVLSSSANEDHSLVLAATRGQKVWFRFPTGQESIHGLWYGNLRLILPQLVQPDLPGTTWGNPPSRPLTIDVESQSKQWGKEIEDFSMRSDYETPYNYAACLPIGGSSL